jgi:hypothetical protein
MTPKKDRELLEALIKQQFDMDDHGIYVYGKREDYATTSKEHIFIDDKIKTQIPKHYITPKDND